MEFNLTSSSGTGSLSKINGYDGGSAGISVTGGPLCCKHSALSVEMTEKQNADDLIAPVFKLGRCLLTLFLVPFSEGATSSISACSLKSW